MTLVCDSDFPRINFLKPQEPPLYLALADDDHSPYSATKHFLSYLSQKLSLVFLCLAVIL